MVKQTYKYIAHNTVVGKSNVELSNEDIFTLYKFFVLYSPCDGCSKQSKNFSIYGWTIGVNQHYDAPSLMLKQRLNEVFNVDDHSSFTLTHDNDLADAFKKMDLVDGFPEDLTWERAVIGKTEGSNVYYKLFRRIRNSLAHGNFSLHDVGGVTFFVMQDNTNHNVTARMIFRKSTLLRWIEIIEEGPPRMVM
jgi:hypothetical protein